MWWLAWPPVEVGLTTDMRACGAMQQHPAPPLEALKKRLMNMSAGLTESKVGNMLAEHPSKRLLNQWISTFPSREHLSAYLVDHYDITLWHAPLLASRLLQMRRTDLEAGIIDTNISVLQWRHESRLAVVAKRELQAEVTHHVQAVKAKQRAREGGDDADMPPAERAQKRELAALKKAEDDAEVKRRLLTERRALNTAVNRARLDLQAAQRALEAAEANAQRTERRVMVVAASLEIEKQERKEEREAAQRLEDARRQKLEAKLLLKKRLKRKALMEQAEKERGLTEKARLRALKKKRKAKAARQKRREAALAAREAGEAYNEEDLDSDSTVDSSYVVVVVVVVCVLACSAVPCILVLATTRFADLGHRGCVAVCRAGIASGPRCPVCQALVIPTHHPLPTAKMLSPLPSRTWLVELMLSTMWCVCNNAHCMAAFPLVVLPLVADSFVSLVVLCVVCRCLVWLPSRPNPMSPWMGRRARRHLRWQSRVVRSPALPRCLQAVMRSCSSRSTRRRRLRMRRRHCRKRSTVSRTTWTWRRPGSVRPRAKPRG